MMSDSSIVRSLTGSRIVAITVFAGLILSFVLFAFFSAADVWDHRRSVVEANQMLTQLQQRTGRGPGSSAGGTTRPGSPFLEGPTITVAGASLLQRVAGAISQVGGTIQSSQVDVNGIQMKDGFVGLLVSCELEQPALQKLLYDLEAGMPFLYIDQLDVQMPQAAAMNEAVTARVRVILGVSGQWQKSK